MDSNTNNVPVAVPVLSVPNASPIGRAPDPPISPIGATRSIDPPGESPIFRSPSVGTTTLSTQEDSKPKVKSPFYNEVRRAAVYKADHEENTPSTEEILDEMASHLIPTTISRKATVLKTRVNDSQEYGNVEHVLNTSIKFVKRQKRMEVKAKSDGGDANNDNSDGSDANNNNN